MAQNFNKMKKLSLIIAIIAICCAQTSFAQQRIEVSDGVFLVSYGNVTVIENDNTQQSIEIKVAKSDNLYDILCGNTVVKTVTKAAIREGIAYAVQSYTLIPRWVTSSVVGYIVDKIYEGVCQALE